MEAQAFVEEDIDTLLDVGISVIPKDSVIYRMIDHIRGWHAGETDWHQGYAKMAATYNYANYGGNCHMVPNHGLIILGLLYGGGDLGESLKVVNTAGWDTDCNSGNLGCLLGIRGGLAAFDDGRDWRGPVADRLILSTADGGRAFSDAAAEAQHVAQIGHALAGEAWTAPKEGARFNFELPGSVQGFWAECDGERAAAGERAAVANVEGNSATGTRSLRVSAAGTSGAAGRARALAATFMQPDQLGHMHYDLAASPTLYPGQRLQIGLRLDADASAPVSVRPLVRVYDEAKTLDTVHGHEVAAAPGEPTSIDWVIPDTGGQPIAQVGLEYPGANPLYLDYVDWSGGPQIELARPADSDTAARDREAVWRRAWVPGVDIWLETGREAFNLTQNSGRGLLIHGARDWQDYQVAATVTPIFCGRGGLAARIQGMRRMYALLLGSPDTVQLIKALDGDTVLARSRLAWTADTPYALRLRAIGNRIEGWVDGERVVDVTDTDDPLTGGGVAFVVEEGTCSPTPCRCHPPHSRAVAA